MGVKNPQFCMCGKTRSSVYFQTQRLLLDIECLLYAFMGATKDKIDLERLLLISGGMPRTALKSNFHF